MAYYEEEKKSTSKRYMHYDSKSMPSGKDTTLQRTERLLGSEKVEEMKAQSTVDLEDGETSLFNAQM